MITQTMAALSLGTSTLRTLISSPTLSLDHIEATTTALADALADADDINQAVDAGNVALPSDQEDDAERELKEMVEAAELEEKKEKEAEEVRRKQGEDAKQKEPADDEAKRKDKVDGDLREKEKAGEREREVSAAALLGGAATPPSATPVERGAPGKEALPAQ